MTGKVDLQVNLLKIEKAKRFSNLFFYFKSLFLVFKR